MQLCLMIEGQDGVGWDDWTALAEACERGGLHGLFRSDHWTSGPREPGSLDAWTTLGGLAARTERIRLGTMVSPVTFRHPSLLAKAALTVDHISGGRVELGLGAGWMEDEHRAYGFPFPSLSERLEHLAEQLEIVHRLWTEDDVRFDGRHYRLEGARGAPKPVQRPRPPIVVGGSARRGTVDPAVRFADEYDTIYVDPEEAGRRRARVREACERAGRDPDTMRFTVMTGCIVATDSTELRERARRVMARNGADGDPDAFLAARRDRSLAGTVDEVAARLHEYARAGVERIYLQHLAFEDVEMVDLVGAELVAAVADA
jgi:F420-dependent oxidoreductase-like protein